MGTKNYYFVLLVLCICFSLSLRSYGQLSVELGNDTTYCTDMTTVSIPMGLKVNINKGVEPFTYAWEVIVVPYGILKPLTASDILNDSTLVSPTIKDAIWAYTDNRVKFVLNITDQAGHHAKDSIHVGFSTCGCVTGYRVIELYKGDSVWLDAGIPQGSVAALYFVPDEGLSNPHSSATWCRPSVTTNYSLARVDTFGCTCTCHVYEIRIIPTNAEVIRLNPEGTIKVFQKGTKVYFNNPTNREALISLFSLDGRLLHQCSASTDNIEVSQLLSEKGTYVVKISLGGKVGVCKFLKFEP